MRREKPEPQPAAGWTCSCGAVNTGKFCSERGAKRPAGAPVYRCDKVAGSPPIRRIRRNSARNAAIRSTRVTVYNECRSAFTLF
ncbi:MAG: hypothetical protein ACLUI3_14955 [Christensenellales bacterium]